MSDINNPEDVKKHVRKRYAQTALTGKSCCCGSGDSPMEIQVGYSREDMNTLPGDSALGLGCGNPTALADIKSGEIVVDLGSGAGIDCFLASQKVGENGHVIGIDMTQEMIDLARKNAREGGYNNVEFRLGEIESLPLEDSSVNLIISNCVINLAPNKANVFSEAMRVLKPGGRIMVSDLVTTEEIPDNVRKSLESWAACIAGALIKDDYIDVIRSVGFEKIAILKEQKYPEDNLSDDLKGKVLSVNVKAFKPVA